MLRRLLPNWMCGLLVAIVLVSNVLLWGSIVLALGLLKLALPFRWLSHLLHLAYHGWCSGNRLALWLGCANIDIKIDGDINVNGWYLLISNHLSWLDIVVLSAINVLPAPKFFLKDELKYVPLIGTGAWAMGMPFMKRVSKAQLAKNPRLKGLDVARTKHSCRNFRNHPTTIINFVEGTRYTAAKHKKQQSPLKYLLKPKAGGIAFALEVLGEQFDAILNTSLIYNSEGEHICGNFLRGRLQSIKVHIAVLPIDPQWLGDYQHDDQFRAYFQSNVNQLWLDKDRHLAAMYAAQCVESDIHSKEIELP